MLTLLPGSIAYPTPGCITSPHLEKNMLEISSTISLHPDHFTLSHKITELIKKSKLELVEPEQHTQKLVSDIKVTRALICISAPRSLRYDMSQSLLASVIARSTCCHLRCVVYSKSIFCQDGLGFHSSARDIQSLFLAPHA